MLRKPQPGRRAAAPTHQSASRRRPRLFCIVVFFFLCFLLLLLYVSLPDYADGGGSVRPSSNRRQQPNILSHLEPLHPPSATPALHSVASLRDSCAALAPPSSGSFLHHVFAKQYVRNDIDRNNDGNGTGAAIRLGPLSRGLRAITRAYSHLPHPFCLDPQSGAVLSVGAEGTRGSPPNVTALPSSLPLTASFAVPVRPLDDTFFSPSSSSSESAKKRSSAVGHRSGEKPVRLIPAVGLLAGAHFGATHFYHLLHDVLEGLSLLWEEEGLGALLPAAQAVLLHAPWLDWHYTEKQDGVASPPSPSSFSSVRGDSVGEKVEKSRPADMSAQLLNSFSFARVGGNRGTNEERLVADPFYSAAIPFDLTGKRNTFPDAHTYCFCEGLLVTRTSEEAVAGAPARLTTLLDRLNSYFQRARRRRGWNSPHTSSLESVIRAYWPDAATAPASVAGSTHAAGARVPRLLFVHRGGRVIAHSWRYVAALRALGGVSVAEAWPGALPAAPLEQYLLGRAADAVIGMHGLGLAHALWMPAAPHGCRGVVEFRPWVHEGFSRTLQRTQQRGLGRYYRQLQPVAVSFPYLQNAPDSAARQERERELLMSSEAIVRAFSLPGFRSQNATYADAAVLEAFRDLKQHLAECLNAP